MKDTWLTLHRPSRQVALCHAAILAIGLAGTAETQAFEEGIPTGACCLADDTCAVTTDVDCDAIGGDFLGDGSMCTPSQPLMKGTYVLRNHPDGNQAPPPYGMRLDEMFDVTANHDKFSFDFEAPGALMKLDYDGTTVHIYGTAFGGLDIGTEYDPAWTSMVEIDFTYTMTDSAVGDDDLVAPIPNSPNSGSLTWMATGDVFDLFDYANDTDPFTFRLGNEDDDAGHRGFDGTSGWGWLAFGTPDNHYIGNDWLFTAIPTCPAVGACCLSDGTCDIVPKRVCRMLGGDYVGDDTTCDACTPEGACCLPDGTCIVTTADGCTGAGGAYVGDNVSCDDANCEVPGACCLPDGTCAMAVESECLAEGGTFQGDGTSCANTDCGDPGACCIDTGCVISTEAECASMSGDYQGDGSTCAPGSPTEPGMYMLLNHPDGNQAPPSYGLRLDELFDVTAGHDIFSFDFEAPGANMKLMYDGTTIRIFGTAFGGLDTGDGYDPAHTSMIEIDFTYAMSAQAPGDDDLIAPIPNTPNSGTVVWMATGDSFDLFDYANDSDPFTFRLGDEDDDAGHRGFDGTSGWGWLAIGTADGHVNAMDWLFTTAPSCPEPGACCLADGLCINTSADECDAQGGTYQGDGTDCADVDCGTPVGACCLTGHDDDDDGGNDDDDDGGNDDDDDGGDDDDDDGGNDDDDDGGNDDDDDGGNDDDDDGGDDDDDDGGNTGDCIETTEDDCVAMGGVYQGDNTWCDDVECDTPSDPSACCLSDGSCVEVDNKEDCDDLGGDFHEDKSCDHVDCDTPDGDQGCTPGYWKNHQNNWPAGYSPNMMFSDVFDDAFPGKTLLKVMESGGGDLTALGRHTVAALLNSAKDDVDYGLTTDEVINLFNAAYPGDEDTYEDLKNDFEGLNESGCPL